MTNDCFKLTLTLQAMKEQRQNLVQDCKEHNYELLHGLRKDINSEVYKLYSEKYTILWLDAHWNRVCSIISQNVTYDRDKREIIEFFVSGFKAFLEPEDYKGTYSPGLFFELLKNKTSVLKDLISLSDKYEKTIQDLLNAKEKHKIQYEKLLKEKMKEKSWVS